MARIVNATFTSVWDGGIMVSSSCYADKDTRMISNIGPNDHPGDDGDLDVLDEEFITFYDDPSNTKYLVKRKEDADYNDSMDTFYYN